MAEIEFLNIIKKFGSLTANDDISFAIKHNSIHCILGENGAGKSTLVKILFGIYKQDSGQIKIDGKEVRFNSPHDAIENGIGMVHQHFMLIDDFTILENVILGNEISKRGKLAFGESEERISTLIKKYNLNLLPGKKISETGIGDQQKVEILKLLYRNSDILIFDEPTSVLSPVETDEFFNIIDEFRQNGKTIILITHKLAEVRKIADAVSVLRKGRLVYMEEISGDNRSFNIENIGNAIIGNVKLTGEIERLERDNIKRKVELKDITLFKNGVKVLDNINLEIMEGEIHGLCGAEGNGQNEAAEIISGIERGFSGELIVDAGKISLVPDDRIKKGFIKEFNIGENMLIKDEEGSIITKRKILNTAEDVIVNYDIRVPSVNAPAGSLSGGNQQKLILAREIEFDSDVMILSHPARGVDLNATFFIHSKIVAERNKGKAILLISSDLDELISLSDRLSIIYKGKILKTFNRNELVTGVPQSELLEKSYDKKIFNKIGKLMIGIVN